MDGAVRFSLRPDLEVVPADAPDGRPALLVHDPVTGVFDRVDWPESDLVALLRRPRSLAELRDAFRALCPLRPSDRDIASYLTELGGRGWLRGDAFWPRTFREPRRGGFFALLGKLLFFQIPFLRPEHFLKATAGLVRLLFNPATRLLLLLCGLAGLYLALPRWEDYWRDSLGSFAPGQAPAFLLAVAVVKTVHEFAHAYTATLAGARVPGMGIAFFLFMPLPFTDVTDAWRLAWPKRLRVAAAGMLAETALAGVTLLFWALSPPGPAATMLARLSSVALLSTLLTNLNPGPRFDGYYILVCLFRMENLRPRGIYELRRCLWRLFPGIRLPDAEAGAGAGRRLALLAYAAYAVCYRFGLGLALGLLAYRFLPKAAGLPAAAGLWWLFWGMPVLAEILRIGKNMRSLRPTLGMLALLALFAGLAIWFVGDWPRRLTFPAVTRAPTEDAVRTQRSGVARSVPVERGQAVTAGQELALLAAPGDEPLLRRAEWALREAETAEEQAWRAEGGRRTAAIRRAEMLRRRGELDALRERTEYLSVRAPASGRLAAWDPSLRPGVSVAGGRLLGWITDGPATLLSCYADLATAGRLEEGGKARFFPDDGTEPMPGVIVRIEASRPETLEDPQLAGRLGAVRAGDAYRLPTPYVKVTVRLDAAAPRTGQTGLVRAWSKPESLLTGAVDWLRSLAVRESAF